MSKIPASRRSLTRTIADLFSTPFDPVTTAELALIVADRFGWTGRGFALFAHYIRQSQQPGDRRLTNTGALAAWSSARAFLADPLLAYCNEDADMVRAGARAYSRARVAFLATL
jgi:hypothetical protein